MTERALIRFSVIMFWLFLFQIYQAHYVQNTQLRRTDFMQPW